MGGKNNLEIRRATKNDVSCILGLIKELADYENLLEEVVATEELLNETLFGINSPAEVNLAFDKKEIVGFALYFQTFSTFLGSPGIYLEDLFVRENFRGRGFGLALLSSVALRAKEIGGGRLEWSVLNWNKQAIGFYKNVGAFPMNDWTMYRLTGEKINDLAKNISNNSKEKKNL